MSLTKSNRLFTNSLNGTELTHTTHPQAIYMSRLLNFKILPEPKNANDSEYLANLIRVIEIIFLN